MSKSKKKAEVEQVAREAGLPMNERLDALRQLYAEDTAERKVDCAKLRETLGDMTDAQQNGYARLIKITAFWPPKPNALHMAYSPSQGCATFGT